MSTYSGSNNYDSVSTPYFRGATGKKRQVKKNVTRKMCNRSEYRSLTAGQTGGLTARMRRTAKQNRIAADRHALGLDVIEASLHTTEPVDMTPTVSSDDYTKVHDAG